jgi:hypothetical protein
MELVMKKFLFIGVLVSALAACSTPPSNIIIQQQPQTVQAQVQQSAVINAPEWMSKLPKSPNAIYENGTATSTDFGMADMKAKTMAYAKICTAAGGKIRSQMKMYKNDTGENSNESTELTVRSMCPDVDITGVETVEMKHVAEGNRIRTYVLVALPINGANSLKATKDAEKRAPEAFKELDSVTGATKPESKVEGVQLIDVDNEDYKRRRDAALQKPGAVIGHATVQDN